MPGASISIFRARSLSARSQDPVLYYLQTLRDEAHRFAIGSHRNKRRSTIRRHPLDEMQAWARAQAGAAAPFRLGQGRGRASLTDLEAVDGVSAALARKIYDFFHERG